jgi:alpha/beta superfamily hydrolase
MKSFLFLATFALTVALIRPAMAGERLELASRQGVIVPVDFRPAANPVRSVILFPGGDGVLAHVRNNFVLRVADRFVQQGISVAIADAPSDTSALLPPFRAGAVHAADMDAVIGFLRQRAAVPVWLVGTSNGTISAASVAARLGPSRVSGVVLTSTVWPKLEKVMTLDAVQVPTMVVHNRLDGCRESPFADVDAGMAALGHAKVKELLVVAGGVSTSGPCEAMSPHGYLAIEDEVVPPIITWIKAH